MRYLESLLYLAQGHARVRSKWFVVDDALIGLREYLLQTEALTILVHA